MTADEMENIRVKYSKSRIDILQEISRNTHWPIPDIKNMLIEI